MLLIVAIFANVHAQVPNSYDLMETTRQQRRDLSLPGSRLALNPYNFRIPPGQKTAAAYSNSPALPLTVGYLSTNAMHRELENLTMLHVRQTTQGQPVTAWQAPLEDPAAWKLSDGLSTHSTQRHLTADIDAQARDDVQSLHLKPLITADLEETPYLEITVPKGTALWAIKVHAAGETTDRTLRQENSGLGTYSFDIPAATGWKGQQKFQLTIYLIGRGTSISISQLALRGVQQPALTTAHTFDTQWQPHKLSFQGHYPDGTVLDGYDFLYDTETIVRQFHVDKTDNKPIVCSGKYRGKLLQIDRNTLVVQTDYYNYAISFTLPASGELAFYETYTDLIAGQNQLSVPPEAGYWSISGIFNDSVKTYATIACSFAESDIPLDSLVKQAHRPIALPSSVAGQLQERRSFWDGLLTKVPHPASFNLHHVDSKGVSPDDIRKAYYKAWVFLAMNVLPPDPNYFPYPQIVTGKPSLWAEGHPHAPFSAAWESFIGMQLYAYIDPDVSWAAFTGLMSLVDESGVLGGESLPSRKAETALLLYRLTGDKAKLAQNYPALKRYMNWRIRYPMWVYKQVSLLSETKKDADFVVSALIDLQALDTITAILELPEDQQQWQLKRQRLFDHYLSWFWAQPDGIPCQLYDTESKTRGHGHAIWVTSGLAIDLLTPPYRTGMMTLLNTYFDPQKSFAGFPLPKYPEMAFTIRGLLAQDSLSKAYQLLECNVRDVVRSGPTFSEQYTLDAVPYGDGVRPSIFGLAQLIDFVLLLNNNDYLTPFSLHSHDKILTNPLTSFPPKSLHSQGEILDGRILQRYR